MIEDYRKELTKSMRAQLDDNQDLKDALQQIKDDKQKMQDTMINHLRNDIEKRQNRSRSKLYLKYVRTRLG